MDRNVRHFLVRIFPEKKEAINSFLSMAITDLHLTQTEQWTLCRRGIQTGYFWESFEKALDKTAFVKDVARQSGISFDSDESDMLRGWQNGLTLFFRKIFPRWRLR
jgi:hypothetical protein